MKIENNKIIHGDCCDILRRFPEEIVDLVYLDPPFFTQKTHALLAKGKTKKYEFNDKFDSLEVYLLQMKEVLFECRRVLKSQGSLFLHCDRTASHHLRLLLESVFGKDQFQSEIVWAYKRWSNSKKGLLNSHQIIYFFSKTEHFKFHTLYGDYSSTTNLDQIQQQRKRDENGTSVYKRDENGNIVRGKPKRGVPLSDVWDIPYLNPKAKERCGYPTQKPVLLLNQVLRIASDENDLVLDPFCGSGTTCVSAKSLNRRYIGIDSSSEAVQLSQKRLNEMVISESNLLKKGIGNYQEKTENELAILANLRAFPVQRNSGIDGFLKDDFDEHPVPVKIQKDNETLEDAIEKLERATKNDYYPMRILVQTRETPKSRFFAMETDVEIIQSLELQYQKHVKTKSIRFKKAASM